MMEMTCLSLSEIRSQLRAASFGGVGFHVESADNSYGHRSVVHEFPGSNSHFTEQLGRKAREVSITGYITGPEWLDVRDRLIEVCESGDAQSFRHPFYPSAQSAKCLTLDVQESRDELGMIRFTMRLVPESREKPSFGGDLLSFRINNALDSFVGSAADVFNGSVLSDIRQYGDSARAGFVDTLRGWANDFEGSRLVTEVQSGAALARSIGNLYDKAEAVVDGGVAIKDLIAPLVDQWRAAPVSAGAAAQSLREMIFTGVERRAPIVGSRTAIRASEVAIATDRLMRRVAGGLWAEATSARDYPGRGEATQARNELVRWLESEGMLIDPRTEPQLFEDFDRFRARLTEEVSRKWTDSSPIVTMTMPRRTSALALAHQLYNDPTRAEELISRNRAANPAAIGPYIEVLAR
ncbi:DNA circularization N-terminal domain-containing protein [Sulfitobacter sp. 1A15106]|uniref:DNA circularization N-terminal domain-containing protein n=1 Tax=Sulfitobacter sp. 1A15106 TaxID=3368590 RepID=UPI0037464AE9